ncbi:MAG: RIO1 family regulatory kinase/ATPase [Candidatus Thorarchaeota archaeon]
MIDLHSLAKILREITAEEIQVLQTLEDNAHRFEYVPVDEVTKSLNIDKDNVLFLLGKLNKQKLVRRKSENYLGYRMSQAGHDALALYDLALKDFVVALGHPYGVGKEATVYRGQNANGDEIAVKFLRWGRTSFRRVRRHRTLKDESGSSWMDLSKQAAEREFAALRKMHDCGGKVPEPIAINRHIIIMSKMTGDLLLQVLELRNASNVLEQILNQAYLAYHKAELIHGDLSEYNIIVNEQEEITIFDWPQWQPITHPNALWLLKRDLTHLLTFFKRQFGIKRDVNEVFNKIIAQSSGTFNNA